MKVGFLQFEPKHAEPEFNINFIRAYLKTSTFDLLVLPELANSGYLHDQKDELLSISEPADGSGPFISGLIAIAAEHKACIVSGFSEKDEQKLYNSAIAVDANGILNHYRKTHLFYKEKNLFETGDTGFSVFTCNAAKIGIMICFDWFFPESARTLALNGAEIIVHPSNLVLPWCQQSMVTRSLENRVYAITANRVGFEKGQGEELEFTGASQVLDPQGNLLIQAGYGNIQIGLIDIDPSKAVNKKLNAYNDLFDDRLPHFYKNKRST
ncbi:MAG: nitrilase-related carbon-nitrogen hydrolase [Anaerolineaceae bacterium]|nr:nitrilase-related carbon-nitrogen hydrolase [Anaerolineaceae bacterium]